MAYASPGPLGPRLDAPNVALLVPTNVLGVKLSVTCPAGKRMKVLSAYFHTRVTVAPSVRVTARLTTAAGTGRLFSQTGGIADTGFGMLPSNPDGIPLVAGDSFALEVTVAAGAGATADFYIGTETWDQ